MDHDKHCTVNPCICGIITAVRSEERETFKGIWALNLRLIERRNYERGYNDRAKGAESRP